MTNNDLARELYHIWLSAKAGKDSFVSMAKYARKIALADSARKAGRVKSKAKARASRKNGKLGGRPRKDA